MKRLLGIGLVAALATLLVLHMNDPADVHGDQPAVLKVAAPEFDDLDPWINSKPLSIKGLRGQVVVVHFWTFG